MRQHAVAASALLLAATACSLSCDAPKPLASAPVADPEANVQFTTAEALADRLTAARGRVLLVNLWATWCPPCVAEMPHLAEFYEQHRGAGLDFLSVSFDDPKTAAENVGRFHKSHELPFPVLVMQDRDPDVLAETLSAPFSGALPVSLLYDAAGKMVHRWDGAVTLEILNEAVEPLLEKT